MTDAERSRLQAELAALRRELAERRASLPAHSVRPHQLLALEELEERIAERCLDLGAEG
ncbi:MAG: histidine kinase [Deltaproteobacteria bacterium]|nr:histidine kinase [Deltaproteobacteria bacterium]